MRAWRVNELGHPSVALALEDVPSPEPPAGQVRIRVEATNVNFADILVDVTKECLDALVTRDIQDMSSDRILSLNTGGYVTKWLDSTSANGNFGTRLCQPACDACSDAGSATRDRDDFVFQ